MSSASCECPHCGKPVPVDWNWEALKTAYIYAADGEVVTDGDCLDARRVLYLNSVKCPHCGTRLRVGHELVPRFFASREGCDDY